MIPAEIVVTAVILFLIYKGVSAHLRLGAAVKRIDELEEENEELREAVIRDGQDPPKHGHGWKSRPA